MFEEWLDETKGKDTFMKGVRAYLLRYSHKNATAAQFLAEISRAANVDVATAFSTFLDQPGVPLVRAQCTVRDGKAVLAVNSERFVPNGGTANRDARFIFPVCAKVIDSGQVRCALIDKAGEIDLAVSSCPVVHPNADGAGYYRFTMPASEQGALLNKLDKLTSGEKLAAAQSLQAAFATASSSLRDVVDAASPLATEKDASLATTPLGFLHFARERLGGDNAAKANARIIVLYSRQLRSLGLADKPGEDAKDVDRRAALVGALWEADPTLRAQLAKEGKAWLDAPHDRLAKDIVSRALHAYVRNDVKDAATWDALLARAKREPDLRVRGWLLWALASVREPALSPKALAMLDDVDLRVNERVIGLWAQGGDTHTAKNTFDFVQKNYADIAQKIPEQWRQRLPAGGGVCSDADADAMHAFFSPKIPEVSGLERSLAQAVEGVRLCAARVRDHRRGL